MHDLNNDQANLLWLLAQLATDSNALSDFLADPEVFLASADITEEAKTAIRSKDAGQVADVAGVPMIKPIRESV